MLSGVPGQSNSRERRADFDDRFSLLRLREFLDRDRFTAGDVNRFEYLFAELTATIAA